MENHDGECPIKMLTKLDILSNDFRSRNDVPLGNFVRIIIFVCTKSEYATRFFGGFKDNDIPASTVKLP